MLTEEEQQGEKEVIVLEELDRVLRVAELLGLTDKDVDRLIKQVRENMEEVCQGTC